MYVKKMENVLEQLAEKRIDIVKCKTLIGLKGVKIMKNDYPIECDIFEDSIVQVFGSEFFYIFLE